MFRLLRFIIRPSNEPTQDHLIPGALWDSVMLKNIKICLPSSAGLDLYSIGTWFSSQQIYRLRRLRFTVLLML